MVRAGAAIAVLLSVIVALYVAPLFRQAAANLEGHISSRPADFKLSAHPTFISRKGQHDHA
jgi:hypothetical protein